MRVTVKDGCYVVTRQRLFEAARSEERVDFERLPLDRRGDRRVVQQRDSLRGAKARQRRFELERLVDRLADEGLDARFAPGAERTGAKTAAKAFDARKSDAADLVRVAVENHDPGLGHDRAHFRLLTRLAVMIAKHADHRNRQMLLDLAGEPTGFGRKAVVGEIAADEQDVGVVAESAEERLKRAGGMTAKVDISNCCDPD